MAGWKVVFCPAATVSHDYEFDKGASKWRYLEHNRLWMVLSNYSPAALVLLAPLLLATELYVALKARREGWWREKREAWRDLYRARGEVARWRSRVQRERATGDRPIVERMRGEMETPLVESGLLPRVNPWMERYRRVVLRLLRS
jgi:GT2 family glycosyltransferase